MKIDVNKLLDLEYLNELIKKINENIKTNRDSFLHKYDLEKLQSMSAESINSLFGQYNVSDINVLQFVESDFIDEDWEFADLFSEDIGYSSGLLEDVKTKALEEVDRLNNEIDRVNDNYQKNIDELEKYIQLINAIVTLIKSNELVSEKDIDNLNDLLIRIEMSEEDKFLFSYNIVIYLIEKSKELSKNETKVDTSEFEKMLDEAYTSTKYVDDKSFDKIEEPVYSEAVLGYYNDYKHLFDEVKLGSTLTEVINFADGLAEGVDSSLTSMTKDDFCVELASLLSLYNDEQKKDRINQKALPNILMDLDILDKLYEEDVKCVEYKKHLLEKIKNDLSIINSLDIECPFKDKINNRLVLLSNELNNNLINLKRKNEISLQYKNIVDDIERLSNTGRQLSELNRLKNIIIEKLSDNSVMSGYITDEYYISLTNMQSDVLGLIDFVYENGSNDKVAAKINEINEKFVKSDKTVQQNERVKIKGFVLFDFDENNKPYVVDDLNPNSKNNMIDVGVLQKKMNSAFEDYNTLINDLFIYGMPRVMKDGVPAHMDRILNPVFFEHNRNYPTGMVRIRPLRNSLVRFVDQKVVLKANTDMQKQVIGVIQEILPNVEINLEEDFSLFVSFCSAIKDSDSDFYNDVINRYLRKSPLYKLFIDDPEKIKLTERECDLLRDIINMTLSAFVDLEKKNNCLNFDIISKIGGKKTRA